MPPGAAAGSAIRRAEGGAYPSIDLDHPFDLAAPPRDRVQEALDQLAQIYAGVGGDRFFSRQPSYIDPAVTVDGGISGLPLPISGGDMDPRHIVPVNMPPGRPPPGSGHNRPPGPRQEPAPPSQPQRQAPRGAPNTQPPPDTASPAAAAAAALRRREDAYKTHREHLRQLDPDHPLLKLEPLSGVVPDQATVDRYGDEVRAIVRKKIDRTIQDLRAWSTYDQRSAVQTIGGDVDLRAEFERLKAG